MTPRWKRGLLLTLAIFVLSFWISLHFGSAVEVTSEVFFELRLPRTLLALAIGMGLAVAGVCFQALFANPLCEPYTMGVSSGSALGAVIGSALGLQWTAFGLMTGSLVGSLAFCLILYVLSLRRQVENTTLLLVGVMLGFMGSSLVALWMALTDAHGIQGALTWLLGDLSRSRPLGTRFCLGLNTFVVLLLWREWRNLDALLLGEETANSVGVDVFSVRNRVLLWSCLLVSFCVSAAGLIGFVGLMVPHGVRYYLGRSQHLFVIPFSALWGAIVVLLADTLGRLLARPYEIPVGVITVLVGAPFFVSFILSPQRTFARE